MKKLLAPFVIIIFFSCSLGTGTVSDDKAKLVISKIKYAQDHRTGLCFAIVESGKAGLEGITCVPCDSLFKNKVLVTGYDSKN